MDILFLQPTLARQSSGRAVSYRHTSVRFLILFLLVVVLLANQYTFNNPQALQSSIQDSLHINQSQFNMLYTIVALPNIVFAILIGIIIDRFGIRLIFLLIATGLPIFQIVVAVGGLKQSYSFMLTGRFLFGLVNQSVIVAQACHCSNWFIGKQLTLALGLTTALPQLGNAANSFFTPIIFQKTQSLSAPLFVSVGVCSVALLCAILVTFLDYRADKIDGSEIKIIMADEQKDSLQSSEFKLSDVKSLRPTYWLIAFLCMFAIAQYIPFLNNSNNLLETRFCFSQVTAGQNVMVTYIVVGFFAFPIGWLVQKVGHNRYFIVLGMTLFPLGQIIILFYPQCEQTGQVVEWSVVSWGLFLIGIGYCFYANCLIASIPLVVKKKVTGTAFGIMEMLENIVMTFFPLITGSILKNAKSKQIGFRLTSLFFTVIGLLGVLLSLLLFIISEKDKAKLDAISKPEIVAFKTKILEVETDSQITKKKENSRSATKKGYSSEKEASHSLSDIEPETNINKPLLQFQIQLGLADYKDNEGMTHNKNNQKA